MIPSDPAPGDVDRLDSRRRGKLSADRGDRRPAQNAARNRGAGRVMIVAREAGSARRGAHRRAARGGGTASLVAAQTAAAERSGEDQCRHPEHRRDSSATPARPVL
jgi:hypothetical protein